MALNADIAHILLSLLDNTTIEKLCLLGLVPSLRSMASSQVWWHARVETVSRRRIPLLPCEGGCWKQTYQILDRELTRGGPARLWNPEDNVTAVRIARLIMAPHQRSDLVLASRHGAAKCVAYILTESDIDPGHHFLPDGHIPIVEAAERGHVEIVRSLLTDPRSHKRAWITEVLCVACLAETPEKEANYAAIVRIGLSQLDLTMIPALWWSLFGNASINADNGEICKALLEDKRAVLPGMNTLSVLQKRGRWKMLDLLLRDPRLAISSNDRLSLRALIPEQREELLIQLSQATDALDVETTARLLRQVDISPWIAHAMMVITFSGIDRVEERLQMLHLILSNDRFSPSISHMYAIQNVDIADAVLVKGKIDPIRALQSTLDNRQRATMELLLRCPSVIAELDKPLTRPMTTETRL